MAAGSGGSGATAARAAGSGGGGGASTAGAGSGAGAGRALAGALRRVPAGFTARERTTGIGSLFSTTSSRRRCSISRRRCSSSDAFGWVFGACGVDSEERCSSAAECCSSSVGCGASSVESGACSVECCSSVAPEASAGTPSSGLGVWAIRLKAGLIRRMFGSVLALDANWLHSGAQADTARHRMRTHERLLHQCPRSPTSGTAWDLPPIRTSRWPEPPEDEVIPWPDFCGLPGGLPLRQKPVAVRGDAQHAARRSRRLWELWWHC